MLYRHEWDRYCLDEPGGWTLAIDLDKRLIGISICSPKDQFNKKIGRKVAEERAYSATGDERMFIITAPAILHSERIELVRDAVRCAIRFVITRYPNTEFGVQFV